MAEKSRDIANYAFVLYDNETGEVRHVHRVSVLHGAKSPAKHEMEARALSLAKKLGRHDPAKLKVLQVEPHEIKPRMKHKIDPKTLKISSEPIPRKK